MQRLQLPFKPCCSFCQRTKKRKVFSTPKKLLIMSVIEEYESGSDCEREPPALSGGKRKRKAGRIDLSTEHFFAAMRNSKLNTV